MWGVVGSQQKGVRQICLGWSHDTAVGLGMVWYWCSGQENEKQRVSSQAQPACGVDDGKESCKPITSSLWQGCEFCVCLPKFALIRPVPQLRAAASGQYAETVIARTALCRLSKVQLSSARLPDWTLQFNTCLNTTLFHSLRRQEPGS